jgi:hypothetical protein
VTNIAAIVDYTAALAAEQVEGIVATFGSGTGAIVDPLRDPATVRAIPDAPQQEGEHWSEVAAMTATEWLTQEGAQHLTWVIPMRVWFQRVDDAALRRAAQPFFARYWTAFTADPTLGGNCAVSRLLRSSIGVDPPAGPNRARWGFLDLDLMVEEYADPFGEGS